MDIKDIVEVLKLVNSCDNNHVVAFENTVLARGGDKLTLADNACDDESLFEHQVHNGCAQFFELLICHKLKSLKLFFYDAEQIDNVATLAKVADKTHNLVGS